MSCWYIGYYATLSMWRCTVRFRGRTSYWRLVKWYNACFTRRSRWFDSIIANISWCSGSTQDFDSYSRGSSPCEINMQISKKLHAKKKPNRREEGHWEGRYWCGCRIRGYRIWLGVKRYGRDYRLDIHDIR